MSKNISPKDFDTAGAITGADDLMAVYQPSANLTAPTADPTVEPTRWRKFSLNTLKTWLAGYFDAVGAGEDAVAAHLMEQDPHTQYVLKTDMPPAVPTLPTSDGLWVLNVTNGVMTWEILNIS